MSVIGGCLDRWVTVLIYARLDPAGKKALSATCKDARRVYVEQYFPRGLRPISIRLSDDAAWQPSGEASLFRRCPECGARTSPTSNILGFKAPGKIGMLTYCKRPKCRDAVLRGSMDCALRALLLDGGESVYLSKASYYFHMEKCLYAKTNHSKSRAIHDSLVTAMMRHVLCPDTTEFFGVCPRLALECTYATIADVTRGRPRDSTNIYIYIPLRSQSTCPRNMSTTNPFNFAPAWNFASPKAERPPQQLPPLLFQFNMPLEQSQATPQLLQQQQNNDEPVPMEY